MSQNQDLTKKIGIFISNIFFIYVYIADQHAYQST